MTTPSTARPFEPSSLMVKYFLPSWLLPKRPGTPFGKFDFRFFLPYFTTNDPDAPFLLALPRAFFYVSSGKFSESFFARREEFPAGCSRGYRPRNGGMCPSFCRFFFPFGHPIDTVCPFRFFVQSVLFQRRPWTCQRDNLLPLTVSGQTARSVGQPRSAQDSISKFFRLFLFSDHHTVSSWTPRFSVFPFGPVHAARPFYPRFARAVHLLFLLSRLASI